MSTVERMAEELATAQLALQAAVENIPGDRYGLQHGEDWSPAQVVAHAIEFQPFWARQIQRMVEERNPTIGRVDEAARQERVIAVKRGALLTRAQALLELRRSAHEALEQVRALSPDQLSRKGVLVTLDTGAPQERTVEQLIASVLSGHLKEHTEQVQRMSKGPPRA
ncbi:MAG: DinB family protein [Chloroflexi bacterium]|nr:DinB family protein [Chloroflexota bacterium]